MFEDFKENFIKLINSRILIIAAFITICAVLLIMRLFNLQLIHGHDYITSFQLMIRKERTLAGVRGNIYDRNGNILAYNELTYSVIIEDVFDSGYGHNRNLNKSVNRMIDILEKSGDQLVLNFKIVLDENGNYKYNVSGKQLMRFLADVYGRKTIDELEYSERIKTPSEVIDYLAEYFGVGDYADPKDSSTFLIGLGYTQERLLKVISVRYAMNLTGFQKYIETVIAENVSDSTVADIQENALEMPGVSIAESTTRRYVDAKYFSPVVGYTGIVSEDELASLSAENPAYKANDIVGKAGIEQTMETALQGEKGSETLFVDNMGKVIAEGTRTEPLSGNHVYLTLDKELQKAAYDILEKKLAGILVQRIANIKVLPDIERTSDLVIPIYDVYYAFFNNYIIDINRFTSDEAKDTEIAVQKHFEKKLEAVLSKLESELRYDHTAYDNLTKEYKVYQTMITNMLYTDGVLDSELVNTEDKTYISWTKDEVISLTEFLKYAIEQNWVNVTLLEIEDKYADTETVFDALVKYCIKNLENNRNFLRRLYKYLINDEVISGRDVCNLLIEQNIVSLTQEEFEAWQNFAYDPYTFIIRKIDSLEITPAQLALDPCSGSVVITDPNSGEVLALVSYPGYDNNRIQNSSYYASLIMDNSRPLYNYATQQRTAPGSTFKPLSATAGLCEGVISTTSSYVCDGEFTKITPSPRCWIYPGGHGSLSVPFAIKHSCNEFFFNVGYDLGVQNGSFVDSVGIEKLKHYCDLYGLTSKSGIEIAENDPVVSSKDVVRTAIGQGNVGYTTIGLARYVTTLANRGTCYDLTLISRLSDREGQTVYEGNAEVRNRIDMSGSYWDAIHNGMYMASQNVSFYNDVGVNTACKTGTAEEVSNRGDHALLICFAPVENAEITVTVRVAFGYTSAYTSQIGSDILKWYFNPSIRSEIVSDEAKKVGSEVVND